MRSWLDVPPRLVLASAITLLGGACAADAAAPPTTSFVAPLPPRAEAAADAWVLSFSDELDATVVDTTKWFVWSGDLHHKGTVNAALPSLAAMHDGSMFVTAASTPENKAFPYATGYVDTHGLFAQTYGKIEFRARAEYAPGVWYALWGRSWSRLVPELDIELLAEDITQAWFVNHWDVPPLPPDARRGFTTVDGLDITKFHVYTITWKSDLVEWQIDGKPYRRVTDVAKIPHDPMFWVMNAWVGGWGGQPSAATQLPAHLEVDYLRIYREAAWTVPPTIRIATTGDVVHEADTIDAELADFASGANVEVWEGGALVERLGLPFHLPASRLGKGMHSLVFVGTDGSRRASTALDVTVE